MFPCVSSDIRQEKGSLKHLCCDYWRHDSSSPSSKDLHSTHSYSQGPDCFHIHAGNTVAFCEPLWRKEISFKCMWAGKWFEQELVQSLVLSPALSPKCSLHSHLYTRSFVELLSAISVGILKKDANVSASVSFPAHMWVCGQTTSSSSTAYHDLVVDHMTRHSESVSIMLLVCSDMGLVSVTHNGRSVCCNEKKVKTYLKLQPSHLCSVIFVFIMIKTSYSVICKNACVITSNDCEAGFSFVWKIHTCSLLVGQKRKWQIDARNWTAAAENFTYFNSTK